MGFLNVAQQKRRFASLTKGAAPAALATRQQ
jgi:hypothetical protein